MTEKFIHNKTALITLIAACSGANFIKCKAGFGMFSWILIKI